MKLVNPAPDRRLARKARKEARELESGKKIEVEGREPYRKPPSERLTRAEAQRRAETIFTGALKGTGADVFCRKSTKTEPGKRCEIGLRSRVGARVVRVVGAGKTWREATKAVIEALELGGAE